MKIVETTYNICSNNKCNYILLSDFHSDFPYKLAYEVRNCNCDFVIFSGDIFHFGFEWTNDKKLNKLKRFINIISEAHPIIMVLGNHDLYKLSKKGLKNFKDLATIKNVYPIYNESIILGNNRFTNILPSIDTFSYMKQDIKRTVNKLVKEYSKIKIEDNSKYVEHLIAHNPYHFNHPEIAELISNYDLIETGHFHGGWIPTKYMLKNLDTILDKSFHELVRNKVLRTKSNSLTVKPRRNLSHGMVYIYEDGYYLVLENNKIYFYDNKSNKYSLSNEKELSDKLKLNKVPAIIITDAVNTFMKMRMFYPCISKINLGNHSYSSGALIKKV